MLYEKIGLLRGRTEDWLQGLLEISNEGIDLPLCPFLRRRQDGQKSAIFVAADQGEYPLQLRARSASQCSSEEVGCLWRPGHDCSARLRMVAAAPVNASFAGRPPTRIMAVTLIGLAAKRSIGAERSTAE